MSLITAFLEYIGTWFGYVGSCVASPNGTCVPFLAFVALGVAAGAALALVLLAYRSAQARDASETRRRRENRLAGDAQEPVLARVPQKRTPAARSPAPSGLHATA
jgi:hypothetical protein